MSDDLELRDLEEIIRNAQDAKRPSPPPRKGISRDTAAAIIVASAIAGICIALILHTFLTSR